MNEFIRIYKGGKAKGFGTTNKNVPIEIPVKDLISTSTPCDMEPEATFEDVCKVVQSHDFYSMIKRIFPEFPYPFYSGAFRSVASIQKGVMRITNEAIKKTDKQNQIRIENSGDDIYADFECSMLDLVALSHKREAFDVKLKKGGLYHKNSLIDPYIFIFAECKIEDGLTVLDIFNFVDSHPDLKAFIGKYCSCNHIDKLHEEARLEPIFDSDLNYTVLKKHFSLICHDDIDYEANIKTDFYGIGLTADEVPQMMYYSLEYEPINTYASLPIRLDDMVEIRQDVTIVDGVLVGPEDVLLMKCSCPFSLFEILCGIYMEIGSIDLESRNQAREDFKKINGETTIQDLLDLGYGDIFEEEFGDHG